MSLTVDGLYKMFPTITGDDIKAILGTEHYDDNTVIRPVDAASYNGKFSSPLSIFFAKNETNAFLPLLDEKRRQRVAENAGIANKLNTDNNQNQNNNQIPGYIPMDTSVFDVAKQEQAA